MTRRIVEVNDVAGLEALREPWRALTATASGGDMFQSYEWLGSWLRTYWRDRRLAFLFAFAGDELVGLVPLLDDAAGQLWCAGSLVTPVNPHVRRQGVLYKGDLTALLGASLDYLFNQRGARCVVFRQLVVGAALSRALQSVSREHGLLQLRREETAGAVADMSAGWNAYVATRDKHVVREMRRKRRKIEEGEGWVFRQARGIDDWRAAFEAVLQVAGSSWTHARGTSIANEPGAREFYGELTRLHSVAGTLRIYLLEHRGRPVAHVLGLVDGTTFLTLKTAYDEGYRDWSPGAVLMWHALEDLVREGLQAVDFLGDLAPWKRLLASSTPAHETLCLFPKGSLRCHMCRSTELVVKPLVRRLGLRRILRPHSPVAATP